ncbi:hypothetical protein CL634_03485 [bacterium]|nr:hypothetical protein [bacterium]
MKDLGISWTEIKESSRGELQGLLRGLYNYNVMHAFDGYSEKAVSDLAKNNPSVRGDYVRTQEMKARFGMRKQHTSFKELLG